MEGVGFHFWKKNLLGRVGFGIIIHIISAAIIRFGSKRMILASEMEGCLGFWVAGSSQGQQRRKAIGWSLPLPCWPRRARVRHPWACLCQCLCLCLRLRLAALSLAIANANWVCRLAVAVTHGFPCSVMRCGVRSRSVDPCPLWHSASTREPNHPATGVRSIHLSSLLRTVLTAQSIRT